MTKGGLKAVGEKGPNFIMHIKAYSWRFKEELGLVFRFFDVNIGETFFQQTFGFDFFSVKENLILFVLQVYIRFYTLLYCLSKLF